MTYENHARFLPWWIQHCSHYDGLLLDIDGTLIAGDHPLPGAVELLAWLRRNKTAFCLLTNDGNRSPKQKSQSLANAGIAIDPSEIISCGMGLELLADNPEFRNGLYFEAGDLGTPGYPQTAGLKTTRDLGRLKQCQGIILGEGDYDWQTILNAAFNALRQQPGMQLIVPNPDSYWPNGPHGEIGIGAGGIARFIQQLLSDAGVAMQPMYLGKPYKPIYQRAFAHLRQCHDQPDGDNSRILMVGDSLQSDICGANRAGIESALVLSGITDRDKASAAPPEKSPRYIFEAL